ncbi:uncharacterized protein LOC134079849 isoform X2 [Sardina pilchardus]
MPGGTSSKGLLCAICSMRASKSCLTCMIYYCETHVSHHYTVPALQRHKLVDITGDLEQRLCPQHHRELEFYCRTDQTPVCALCAVIKHNGHDIAELEQNPQMKENKPTALKNLPAPKPIQLISVKTDSVCLSWGAPDGLTEPHSFRVTWRSGADRGEQHGALSVPGLQVDIQNLTPGEKYTFTVATLSNDGSQSACVSANVHTDIPVPENVSLKADLTSVSVSWSKPAGVDEVSYLLTLNSGGEYLKTVTTKSLQCSFSGLDIGREYSISASTVLKNGGHSKPISKTFTIDIPAPENVSLKADPTSVSVSWSKPAGVDEVSYLLTLSSDGEYLKTITTESLQCSFSGLDIGRAYSISAITVLKNGGQSKPISKTITTDIPAPENVSLKADQTSVSVSWSKPAGVDEVSYLLTLSSGGEYLKTITTESLQCSFSDLMMGKEYSISVITVQKNGGQSKPISTTIPTGKEQFYWACTNKCLIQLIAKCELIKSGSPACYLLPTEKTKIDGLEAVRRWTYGTRDESKPTKTILIVGQTGTGKSTLINTMVNYVLGVQWEDRAWFQITAEDKNKKQIESQTSSITVYELFLEKSSCGLRIIDTPGYGDTKGINFDKQIAENLHVLFKSEDGIHDIEVVGLVVKASQNRLTDSQKYIFRAILSLFGKDVEKNIVIFITYSDGLSAPHLIEALNIAKVPCAKDPNGKALHFMFNNRQNEAHDEDQKDSYKALWNLGYKSMSKFFNILEGFVRTEVKMTEGVLRARKRLVACVNRLQDSIRMEELKQNELQQIQKALEENKVEFEVDEPYMAEVPIESSWWHLNKGATVCTVCKENCHYPDCWWVKDLSWCSAMSNNKCTVCTGKCHYSQHAKVMFRYVPKTKKATKTIEHLKQQYDKEVDMKKALEKDLSATKANQCKLLEEAYQCIMKLEEIALQKAAFSTPLNLEFVIEKMKKKGDGQKVQKLEELNTEMKASSLHWVTDTVGDLKEMCSDACNRVGIEVGQEPTECSSQPLPDGIEEFGWRSYDGGESSSSNKRDRPLMQKSVELKEMGRSNVQYLRHRKGRGDRQRLLDETDESD